MQSQCLFVVRWWVRVCLLVTAEIVSYISTDVNIKPSFHIHFNDQDNQQQSVLHFFWSIVKAVVFEAYVLVHAHISFCIYITCHNLDSHRHSHQQPQRDHLTSEAEASEHRGTQGGGRRESVGEVPPLHARLNNALKVCNCCWVFVLYIM